MVVWSLDGILTPTGQRSSGWRSGLSSPAPLTHTLHSCQTESCLRLCVSSAPSSLQLSHLTSLSSDGLPLPTVSFQLTSTIKTSSLYLLEEVSSTSLLTSKFKCPSPLLPPPSVKTPCSACHNILKWLFPTCLPF